MPLVFEESTLVALVALFGGVLLGLAARLGRFCSLGAIEDYFYGGSTERLRIWGLAIGLSVIGTFGLIWAGQIDETRSIYLSASFSPLAAIFGGLLFGYGMALAGNCGYGALARLGGGDLRSLVIVMVMGLSAYITVAGPLAPLRQMLFARAEASTPTPGLAHQIGDILSLSPALVGVGIGLLILFGTLLGGRFSRPGRATLTSLCVATAIVSAWWGTTYLADHSFDATPVVSHSFTAPVGEALLYLMTSTGSTVTFGVGSVVGVILGAFIGSLIKGHFRWEACEDPRELRRQMLGAGFMGIGAVIAMGCTIGQGLSAFSVLAVSAPITALSIVVGASFGLRQLIVGFGRASEGV